MMGQIRNRDLVRVEILIKGAGTNILELLRLIREIKNGR